MTKSKTPAPKKAEAKRAGPKKSDVARNTQDKGASAVVEASTPEKRFRVLAGLSDMLVPISSLNEDTANARRHPERNLEAIKASLAARGQHAPLVVQEEGRVVRVGNGRLRAAKALGWTHVAAVVIRESEVEASARAIADNRAGELAEWDGENLIAVMAELQAAGAGEGLSFDAGELARIRGDFAAPANGEEVFGSVADGLVIRGSVMVKCRKEDVLEVERRLREAIFTPGGRQGWSVQVRKRQGVREVAQKRRDRAQVERDAERARLAAG